MILDKSLEIQLTRLIVEPFRALGNLDDMPNRLVIIDGLDECIKSDQEFHLERKYAQEQERVQIRVLDLIFALHSHNFPLSFLILSRPEVWIKQHMESSQFKPVTETIDLYEGGDHLRDVEVYLKAELSRIAASLELQPGEDTSGWPEPDTFQRLLKRTGGHMLFASTVVRHIDDPYEDPRMQLQDILEADRDDTLTSTSALAHSSSFSALYELYRQIMRSCPDEHRPLMLEVLEDLMAFSRAHSYSTIRAALPALDRLCGRAPGRGMKAIRNIRAVTTTECQGSPAAFFIHSSFPEFLLNPKVAREFTVKREAGERRLLLRCLDCMAAVDLSTDVVEGHVQAALRTWLWHWRSSEPSDEAEYITQLKLLLALDLKACIVQGLKVDSEDQQPGFPSGLEDVFCGLEVVNIRSARSKTTLKGFCSVDLELDQWTATLEEECTLFFNSSFEQALAHFLQPVLLQGLSSLCMHRVCFMLAHYLRCSEGVQGWDSSANKLVQAMDSLRKDHPHIHQELIYHFPRYKDPTGSPVNLSEKYPFMFDVSDEQYIVEKDKCNTDHIPYIICTSR